MTSFIIAPPFLFSPMVQDEVDEALRRSQDLREVILRLEELVEGFTRSGGGR